MSNTPAAAAAATTTTTKTTAAAAATTTTTTATIAVMASVTNTRMVVIDCRKRITTHRYACLNHSLLSCCWIRIVLMSLSLSFIHSIVHPPEKHTHTQTNKQTNNNHHLKIIHRERERERYRLMKLETIYGDIVINENMNLPHSGARVWSSSQVLSKYLERHRRKLRVRGKVLELGAGCGMNGIMMSKLGCEMVVFTDLACMLEHLRLNVDLNLLVNNRATTRLENTGRRYAVRELDWNNEQQMKQIKEEFGPNFDFIIGSDVVYQEEFIEPLLATLFYFTSPSSNTTTTTTTTTTIIIAYEIRNESAHELFLQKCTEYSFELKQIPTKQQHESYREELVLLFHLKRMTQ
jgi:predicted nicotinamide N-methyase